MNLYDEEISLHESGIEYVCGVDEAGRGPLAGPVCAAAVILEPDVVIEGLNDSKKLSETKREILYEKIMDSSISIGIAFASVEEIEKMNILNATFLAMNRAIELLDPAPEIALIDGNQDKGIHIENKKTIVKGDSKCACIAAASILAKVTRDRYMIEMDELYPEYQFKRHKGYGTKIHYEALRKYGPSPIHRNSFLKKLH